MKKETLAIFIFVALISPIQILAQDGSVPEARVMDVPTPATDASVSATSVPVAVPAVTSAVTPHPVLTTVVPTPTPRPSPGLEQESEPQSLVLEQQDLLPEDWFYKYALTLLGVGGGTLLSYGVLKFNKSKHNKNEKDSDGKCGSIRELLEQKKKELEAMIKSWPQDKLKQIVEEKVAGQLEKNEETKKLLEIKNKYDEIKKTIEMLQKKYDLCMLEVPSSVKKYTMRIVEGALTRPDYLDKFSPKKLEYFDETWKNLLGVDLTIDEIKEVQKIMIKHYEGPEPWFMDGHALGDSDEIICAFGADDGEGGRIFKFKRDDKKAFQKAKEYALSKGIPEEQFDFVDP